MRTNLVRLLAIGAVAAIGRALAPIVARQVDEWIGRAFRRAAARINRPPDTDHTAIPEGDYVLGSHWYAAQPTPELDRRLAELRGVYTILAYDGQHGWNEQERVADPILKRDEDE